MKLADLLPETKVTAYLLGGALTIAVFWILIETGRLEDWPEAWVMAAFAVIAGFVVAWVVPDGAWKKARRHLSGTVSADSNGEPSAEVEGDVTLTQTGEGTADIEGEVRVDEDGEITGDTGEAFDR